MVQLMRSARNNKQSDPRFKSREEKDICEVSEYLEDKLQHCKKSGKLG